MSEKKSAFIVSSVSQQPTEQEKKSPTIKDTANNFINNYNFDNYSLYYKKGKVFVVGHKGKQTLTLKVEQTGHGGSIEATNYNLSCPKSDLTSDIMALRKQGKTQTEVAAILNISQSYVSFLERQHNNNLKND